MGETEARSILEQVNRYKWYHSIRVTTQISTTNALPEYQELWDFSLRMMDAVDFNDKRVLDIGCRDGRFSFEAEKRGATEVIGIDNDLSLGATEFLIPFFNSRVRMHQMNVYDLTPRALGIFDIILCFGVLYHLRYPVWGLKRLVDCLSDGGLLLIESGMIVDSQLDDLEFMYCPFEQSPYEPTSCTFFNQKGLSTTMRSLNCRFVDCQTLRRSLCGEKRKGVLARMRESLRALMTGKKISIPTARQFLIYRKDESLKDTFTTDYWNGNHHHHSDHGV